MAIGAIGGIAAVLAANPEIVSAAVAGAEGIYKLVADLLRDHNSGKMSDAEFVTAVIAMKSHFAKSSDDLDTALAIARARDKSSA